jgi:tetratricopeptide (TPR) repeat protein
MTRLFLAIPVRTLLLASLLLFPSSAQTNPDAPQLQPPASVSGAQTPKMSEEDMARLYLIRKQYHEAQDLFYKLTQEQPKNAIYWNELGISFHNQIELGAALKCYEKSAKLNPHYADAQNNIGTIWYERKKYSKAIRAYKRALGLRDDFAPFYVNLGYAYFGARNYEGSITSFRQALRIDPDALDPSRSRSGTVIQDRSLASDRAQFYFLLAKSFAQAGNVERCAIYLRKAKDEGYKDLNTVKSDPAFASVLTNPAIQEIIAPKPVEAAEP